MVVVCSEDRERDSSSFSPQPRESFKVISKEEFYNLSVYNDVSWLIDVVAAAGAGKT